MIRFPFLNIVIILFVFTLLGQKLSIAHHESNTTFDLYNFTESSFKSNVSLIDKRETNSTYFNQVGFNRVLVYRLHNVVFAFIDFFSFSFFEFSKIFFELGYEYAEYNVAFLVFIFAFLYMLPLLIFFTIIFVGLFYLLYKVLRKASIWAEQKKKVRKGES